MGSVDREARIATLEEKVAKIEKALVRLMAVHESEWEMAAASGAVAGVATSGAPVTHYARKTIEGLEPERPLDLSRVPVDLTKARGVIGMP